MEKLKEQKLIDFDKAREKAEKIAFTKSLNDYSKRLREHRERYEELLNLLENGLSNINVSYSEVEEILDELQKLDLEYKKLIPKVPKRYKPTPTQEERLYEYESKLNAYLEKVSGKREELNKMVENKLEIRDLKTDFKKKYNGYVSDLEEKINIFKRQLTEKNNTLLKDYNQRGKKLINALKGDKDKLIGSITSKQQIRDLGVSIEKEYNRLLEEAEQTLFSLTEHVNRLSFDIDEEQIQGVYKARYDKMKYRWEQTRDAAQLGIAVEIIDHEFNQLYEYINYQLHTLHSNPETQSMKEFQFLERYFKQLEYKYTLLSPLYRISGALLKDISCSSVYEYLKEFFEKHIRKYNIRFEVSDSFKNHTIRIKEPVIYTVFINIINNAIYWMLNKEERFIRLDYQENEDELIIANSGEKIPDYKLDRIFELFYSQRPYGRGIGLYLSKKSLNDSGFDIHAKNSEKYNEGACFVISKI